MLANGIQGHQRVLKERHLRVNAGPAPDTMTCQSNVKVTTFPESHMGSMFHSRPTTSVYQHLSLDLGFLATWISNQVFLKIV